MRLNYAEGALRGRRRHARRSPRGRDDARGDGADRAARARRIASDHSVNRAVTAIRTRKPPRPRGARGQTADDIAAHFGGLSDSKIATYSTATVIWHGVSKHVGSDWSSAQACSGGRVGPRPAGSAARCPRCCGRRRGPPPVTTPTHEASRRAPGARRTCRPGARPVKHFVLISERRPRRSRAPPMDAWAQPPCRRATTSPFSYIVARGVNTSFGDEWSRGFDADMRVPSHTNIQRYQVPVLPIQSDQHVPQKQP